MAETATATGLTVQQWDDKFFAEYIRASRFKKYMGTDENALIQMKDDLTVKPGNKITFARINKLSQSGRTGNQTLNGNEEALDNRSLSLTVDWLRHGVVVPKSQEQLTGIPLRSVAKTALKNWAQEKLKTDLIAAFASIDGVAYTSASAAQKNAWEANNADRILMGALKSNRTGTHATSLGNIDNTDDKLSPAMISLAKRMAQAASPSIQPIRLADEDEEWFVMFANALAFRDLSANSVMTQANREARPRDIEKNPLFTGGSLVWDGVIIREIPEIAYVASTIQVGPNYLCGAQALGIGYAQRTKTTEKVDTDYGFKPGVGIEECRGIEKLRFGTDGSVDTTTPKDNGMVTVFAAAVADA